MSGQLILVGTPIGHLSDLSPRALEALQNCDLIAAEDTRVTLKLLNHFGIRKPLISYFEHNKLMRGEELLQKLQQGCRMVLVSDAGMPAISDPGQDLVARCHQAGVPVTVIPGPCAAVAALALSGMPAGRFTFEGFLSVNKGSRREHLEALRGETRTMIFYEAPHKLKTTLKDLYAAFGDRPVALVRELTKIYEECVNTTLAQAVRLTEEKEPRGEYVLIVGGAEPAAPEETTLDTAVERARTLRAGGMSASAAARQAAADTGWPRGEIYKRMLEE
ncbi:MAG: 16S rRNA (cytidine(1402)-2'-O)-methyltransferase [Clostridia bacterium]|nr:16S rRNA (cytidine(1402)-2'-O)-methyltransferase [Clostridia bacterium]